MSNKDILKKRDEEILKRVCDDYGVEVDLIKDLIQTEKDSQLRSRHGIYDNLKSDIKNYISQDEN